MATLIEIRDKANAKLATLWPVIQAKQDAYFTKHGQYFGLRWSPAAPVVDGVDTDLIIEKPSRGNVLADIDFTIESVPFQISIERLNQSRPNDTALKISDEPKPAPVYGATGETYRAWVRIQLPNGDVYMRSRMQDNTDSGWFKDNPLI